MYRMKVISVTAVLLAVLLCESCAVRSRTSRASDAHPRQSPEFDRQFLQNIIHYYDEETRMVQYCVEKAQRPELMDFCREIMALERENLSTLQNWLGLWYGVAPSASASGEEHSSETFRSFISKARSATGPEFEEALLSGLRLHHHHGIDDLTSCEGKASHADLKDFCRQESAVEKRQINQMTKWICQWFKDCLETPIPE